VIHWTSFPRRRESRHGNKEPQTQSERIYGNRYIAPAKKIISFAIPAKAGIQRKYWMPDQACP